MKYRLNNAETTNQSLYYVPQTKMVNGQPKVVYERNRLTLVPHKVYETDDEAMLEYLKDYTVKIRYNAQTESALKQNGVPYRTEMCPSCSGKVKKIIYNLVEVFDE